ncbi:MAG: preprotein translocase subunit YajC [Bacillota bacterium]
MKLNPEVVSLLYLVGLFVLLYFLLIRPQQVRQKRHQEMVRNLRLNDQVITAGGIFGTIVKLKDDSVILRVADNVRIEVLRQSIAQVVRRGDQPEGE